MCYYYLVKFKSCKKSVKYLVPLFHHKCTSKAGTNQTCPVDDWKKAPNVGSMSKPGVCPECG